MGLMLSVAVAIPPMATAPAFADDVDPMGNGWYPEGFPAFCESHPADCLPVRAEKISFAENLPLLEAVNGAVNKEITYRLDEGHPEKDVWSVSPSEGDCEDYAVTKLRRLTAAGLPRGAFRFAFGDTPSGRHTLLLVWTDKGEFALDNRSDEVIDLRRMILYTLSLQDAGNPRVWWRMY